MAGQEREALGVVTEEHGAQVAVALADLAVLGDGAGDAEGLEALADHGGGLRGALGALLDGDGAAADVGPLGVLERDGLDALDDLARVHALVEADLLGLLEGGDAVLSEHLVDLVDAALIALKRNCHIWFSLPFYS